jgi:hypothetical protein
VRRLRSGRSGGSALLGVVAAAVLVVALVVVGRSVSGHGTRPAAPPASTAATAPYRIGGRVVCPLARPVLATSDGRSYPPGHPARPPREADPVACYDTAAEAAAAGYARAALPAGVSEVGGVYLLPTSGRLRGRCRQAAERLGLAVPCPRLLPALPPGAPPPTVCDQRWRPCDGPGSGFLLEVTGFLVPSGYIGAYPEEGERLAVAAARRPTAFAVTCPGERPLAHAGVRGTRGRLFECPLGAGPHGGGVLLRWRERGAVVAVSVSGHTDPYRRLALGLAARLELVPPAGSAGGQALSSRSSGVRNRGVTRTVPSQSASLPAAASTAATPSAPTSSSSL